MVRVGGGGQKKKGRIYNDFSFFALGESAPWECTPLTPLAKKRGGHIQISFSLAVRVGGVEGWRRRVAHLCLSSICSWGAPVSFSGSELGCAPSTAAAES